MNYSPFLYITALAAFIFLSLIYHYKYRMKLKDYMKEALNEISNKQNSSLQTMLESLKLGIKESSYENLTRSTSSIMEMANGHFKVSKEAISKELETNKDSIEKQMQNISGELQLLKKVVSDFEKDRGEKYSEISALIKKANDQTQDVMKATGSINKILSGSQSRGQWGERLADDVLKIAGFVEGVNYSKQHVLESGERPDFTFFISESKFLHMDVKFPISNYKNYIATEDPVTKEKYLKQFFVDVKNSFRSLKSKNYMNPNNTVNCVLLFIPNESLYAFIQQKANDIFEFGLKNNIIACSPLTLFSVLAVVRKSVENFNIEKSSQEILVLLETFQKQWNMFTKQFSAVDKKIIDLKLDFDKLTGVRTKQLDSIIKKVNEHQTKVIT